MPELAIKECSINIINIFSCLLAFPTRIQYSWIIIIYGTKKAWELPVVCPTNRGSSTAFEVEQTTLEPTLNMNIMKLQAYLGLTQNYNPMT